MTSEKPNVVHVPWADRIPDHFRVLKDDGMLDIDATVAKLNESYLAELQEARFPRIDQAEILRRRGVY